MQFSVLRHGEINTQQQSMIPVYSVSISLATVDQLGSGKSREDDFF